MSQDNSCSPRKKPLNNSNSDLRSVDNTTNKLHVLHVHNMLNADKENAHYAPMEKNLARSLRPALRTVNQQMAPETPKVNKQIRFNLGSGHNDSMTPTPPPKEFKRFGARKTLRNERCLSGIEEIFFLSARSATSTLRNDFSSFSSSSASSALF